VTGFWRFQLARGVEGAWRLYFEAEIAFGGGEQAASDDQARLMVAPWEGRGGVPRLRYCMPSSWLAKIGQSERWMHRCPT